MALPGLLVCRGDKSTSSPLVFCSSTPCMSLCYSGEQAKDQTANVFNYLTYEHLTDLPCIASASSAQLCEKTLSNKGIGRGFCSLVRCTEDASSTLSKDMRLISLCATSLGFSGVLPFQQDL